MIARIRWPLLIGILITLAIGLSNCSGKGGRGKGTNETAPSIVIVTPGFGPLSGGTVIIVVTDDFKDDFRVALPEVRVGGIDATGEAELGAETVTVVTPLRVAPDKVDVEVLAQNGQSAILTDAFEYIAPAPPDCDITSLSPSSGSDVGGYAIIIIGTDFEIDPTTDVTFGGASATNVVVQDDTLITCVAPPLPGASNVDVIVRSTNTTCTLAGGFTYVPNPTCSIALPLSPPNGSVVGGTWVSISGTGFEDNSIVTFDGIPATRVAQTGGTLLVAETPAAWNPAGAYSVEVAVRTPGGAVCSQPDAFTYDLAVVNCNPSGMNPPNGPQSGGTAITISGTDFKPVAAGGDPVVTFGGLIAPVSYADDTRIDCTAPTAPNEGPVDVRISNNTGGTCELPGGYTYDPAGGTPCEFDLVTPISPASGEVGLVTPVTIRGLNFEVGATAVFFGGVLGTNISVSAPGDMISCETPPGSSLGFVDVEVVPQSGAPCTLVDGFEYTGCSFTVLPNWGPVQGTNSIAIGGIGFELDASQVFFGGTETPQYWVRLANQIVCEVPPSPCGACFVDVTVANPGAGTQCTKTSGYEYRGCVITDIQPRSDDMVGGVRVTITGTDFDPAGADVFFGSNFAINVSVDPGGMEITCDAPPSLIDGPVDVEVKNINLANICPSPFQFTYNPPSSPVSCTIDSIWPEVGPLVGGTFITIKGSNFDTNGAAVIFCCVAASDVNVISDTEITCINPPASDFMGGGAVNVSVVSANGGTCTRGSGFMYQIPFPCNPCTATSMTPDPAISPLAAGGETAIRTITGSEFCELSGVQFMQLDGAGQPVVAWGDVQSWTLDTLEVVAPPAPIGPGPVIIMVDNAGAGLCGSIVGAYQ